MVYHDYKAIQLHIGKTGGTSIEVAFGLTAKNLVKNGKHWRPRQIIAAEGQAVWDSYFKFSFVRNPWDRLVSKYFDMRDISKQIPADRSFEQFANLWIRKHGRWNPWDQISWFQGRLEEFDFVGRFETLEEDFGYICTQISAELSLPKRRSTKHEHYSVYYDDRLCKKVAKMAKADIKAFGYSFENG